MPALSPDAQPAGTTASAVETVLVVDDEESFRTVVVRQLRNAGFASIEARDGSEAIRIFGERRDEITAVLLDFVMPNTSGVEALSILRYYAPELPVIVTSGYSAFDPQALKTAERGVAFLKKPFTAVELETELRRVIAERLPRQRHSTPPKPPF